MLIAERQLLVLSAGLHPDGTPSKQTRERAEVAGWLSQNLGTGPVVFSGGYPLMAPELGESQNEAQIMKDIAISAGMSPKAGEIEKASHSILSNVINSAPLLRQKDTLIIVHRLQAIRTEYTARRLLAGNISVLALSEPDNRKRSRQEMMLLMVTAGVLRGLSPGDTEEAARRVERLEKAASIARPILKRTVLTDHTALGS
ncbi:MAG TPA: YdcF family protein [Candidatus Saccharimonadia bacterium]|nr:YdcF family protein [Candidatus Saccharimonadia bacterium]